MSFKHSFNFQQTCMQCSRLRTARYTRLIRFYYLSIDLTELGRSQWNSWTSIGLDQLNRLFSYPPADLLGPNSFRVLHSIQKLQWECNAHDRDKLNAALFRDGVPFLLVKWLRSDIQPLDGLCWVIVRKQIFTHAVPIQVKLTVSTPNDRPKVRWKSSGLTWIIALVDYTRWIGR